MGDRFCTYPAKQIPVTGDYDVVVVGGGCADSGTQPRNADVRDIQKRLVTQGAEIGQGRTQKTK